MIDFICYKRYYRVMKKLVLMVLALMFCLSAQAGQYEDALRTGNPVCLYMYTKTCGYCKQANPIFEKLSQNYRKHVNFVRIDAETPYGYLLMRDLRVGYVPYVVLADAKRQYFVPVTPSCAIEYACIEKELKDFIK